MARGPARSTTKSVEALKHDEAQRRNIPTAELQSFAEAEEAITGFEPGIFKRTRQLAEGEIRPRDTGLDPQIVWNGARITLTKDQVRSLVETGETAIGDTQLVWRGKDQQDWSDLIVQAPPLYIQEKIHPKAIIDDLRRTGARPPEEEAPDLFSDFNGLDPEARTEFYQHDQHWSNRMILGDSLQVMASLTQREGMNGQVQCIYFDPPYGIKFNSNWQVSTQSRDVKDGRQTDISREPEQVKAFRDTWKDGIHSYLTYLRDRLTVARELLTESGSIFVQIGDENVHRVRSVLEEVFGEKNLISMICLRKTGGQETSFIPNVSDYILWFAKNIDSLKYRQLYFRKEVGIGEGSGARYDRIRLAEFISRPLNKEEKGGKTALPLTARPYQLTSLISSGVRANTTTSWTFQGKSYHSGESSNWKTSLKGLGRLALADRIEKRKSTIAYVRFIDDFAAYPISNVWTDVAGAAGIVYVVQTSSTIVQRCILMATDPGDLVLDPTCGSGTTATVAEQWGRRWITIDTSRVALALARTRLMSARYPYYLLADSPEGRAKEQAVSGRSQTMSTSLGDIRQGFVNDRAPHVTLKSIANNAEIDVIWEQFRATLDPLREKLNALLQTDWQEWEIPRDPERPWDAEFQMLLAQAKNSKQPLKARQSAVDRMNAEWGWDYTLDTLPERPVDALSEYYPDAVPIHAAWWETRIACQRAIDASIARAAEVEMLYDRPYADAGKVRVAGPFTVESLSPHRIIPSDSLDLDAEFDALDGHRERTKAGTPTQDFSAMVLENLAAAGVQGRDRADRMRFTLLQPWPGRFIGAEGRFVEGGTADEPGVERRAGILIGPEFGTLSRPDLVAAAREAADSRFDVLVACAFAYDAHASELTRLGPLPILQAKMNPDLHMADDLKTTGKGNLFVVFGEPDIEIRRLDGDRIEVEVKGIDVFDPNTGDVRSDDTSGIAAWFVDTDYNEESFFVRQSYFLGANDPYKSLKAALKAEIDEASWATLYRAVSRPFARPATGRIAVKVINHFGDEVMKVYVV
ncbi:site-specific DNA-methyltransferase [Methylobacterium sp. Leaf106]|uniref:site-specific DNA-methyltransferase n=1 Tax=Methylobacterium sp. Leaf106 TaxID=1736255 RepID=UPI000701545D|nr:site-specific DNA-methyltransferase [Methylobacterium sp. Leaf106]KQP44970.1 DNA methylase [Methylobacterium sp. Leaf106]